MGGVLTREEILKEIKKGRIKIEPFEPSQIGPASIDLSLGEEFRRTSKNKRIVLEEETTSDILGGVTKEKEVTLKAGEFIHGITKEKVSLPEDLCGILTGRSRFARMGLAIHATAAFIQPGVSNKQVLEIKNLSENILVLRPGLKICQLIIQRTEGKAKYNGRYANQTSLPK